MERRAGLYGALPQAQLEEPQMIDEHGYQEEHLEEQELADVEFLNYHPWEGETDGEIAQEPQNGHMIMRREEPQGEEYDEFDQIVAFNDVDGSKGYIVKMHAEDLMGSGHELIEDNGEGPSQYIHEDEEDHNEAIYRLFPPGSPPGRRRATEQNCEICGLYLKHPSKIAAHMRTHTGERPFTCETCGRGFTQRTPWRMHMKRHLQDLPFLCTHGCGKAFPNESQRRAHDLRHQGMPRQGLPRPHLKPAKRLIIHDPLPLDEVHEVIMDRQGGVHIMDAPLYEDEEAQPLTKEQRKRIDEVINAVAENRSIGDQVPVREPHHLPPPPVPRRNCRSRRQPPIVAECQICGLMLKHPSKIQAHMRSHTGHKPFKCSICGLSVATKYALRNHKMRRHTEGERPFECTWECGLRFVNVSARNEHERIVHSGVKRFLCNVGTCSRLFTRRNHLDAHRLQDHPGLVHIDEYDDLADLDYDEIHDVLDEEMEDGGVETVDEGYPIPTEGPIMSDIEEEEGEGEEEEQSMMNNVFHIEPQQSHPSVRRVDEGMSHPSSSSLMRVSMVGPPGPPLLPPAIPIIVPRLIPVKVARIGKPIGSGMQ